MYTEILKTLVKCRYEIYIILAVSSDKVLFPFNFRINRQIIWAFATVFI